MKEKELEVIGNAETLSAPSGYDRRLILSAGAEAWSTREYGEYGEVYRESVVYYIYS